MISLFHHSNWYLYFDNLLQVVVEELLKLGLYAYSTLNAHHSPHLSSHHIRTYIYWGEAKIQEGNFVVTIWHHKCQKWSRQQSTIPIAMRQWFCSIMWGICKMCEHSSKCTALWSGFEWPVSVILSPWADRPDVVPHGCRAILLQLATNKEACSLFIYCWPRSSMVDLLMETLPRSKAEASFTGSTIVVTNLPGHSEVKLSGCKWVCWQCARLYSRELQQV